MKTLILTKTGLVPKQADTPQTGADELLIETLACGVCEGDVFRYRQRGALTEPLVLGHEGTGRIIGIGAAVSGFEIGDIVTTLEGTAREGGGAYAEVFTAKAAKSAKVPAGLNPVEVLGEPVACCVHASWRFGIKPGDRVAIIGCGFMGLICLQLARHQGASHIVVYEPLEFRRRMALELGATVACDPGSPSAQSLSETDLCDVVIEATGVQAALDLAGTLVKPHGRLIIIGYHQSDDGFRKVNMKLWNYRAITVENGHVRRAGEKLKAMQEGLELIARGVIQTGPLIKTYSLDTVEQGFNEFIERKEGVVKLVIVKDETRLDRKELSPPG